MHIGIIGLGKMGMNMARRLIRGGHNVTAFNRTPERVKEIEKEGAQGACTIEDMIASLPAPRVIWLMVPAGKPVDDFIERLKPLLERGDIIVDGGNSFYKDDIRHEEGLRPYGIRYIDAGVSGGIWGLEIGYCLMIGGYRKDYDYVEPVLKTLAPENGYLYCGKTGSGHFVKMVHNGIEYGMMAAYAEGFEVLKASQYGDNIDLSEIADLWNHGSVIRSWLLELAGSAFTKDKDLSTITGYVEDSGEGRWMVQQAVDTAVPLPVISSALFQRFRSREAGTFADKVLAALRHEFGGHEVVKKE